MNKTVTVNVSDDAKYCDDCDFIKYALSLHTLHAGSVEYKCSIFGRGLVLSESKVGREHDRRILRCRECLED